MCVCVCVCLPTMTLKWYNMVNSKYIVTQLNRRVDIPQRYIDIEIWHSPSTRITAFVTTLAVSPKSLKCNISITNCPIALKFDTGVKFQKIHTKKCQWLDKHINCICENTFCIPQFFEMQYLHEKLSDCSQILHRGAVTIEEYLYGVNMAHMIKSGQLRANITK